MKTKTHFFAVLVAICLATSSTNAASLNFDGTTDSGWSLVNGADGSDAFELIPVTDFSGSGLSGLEFNDLTGGVMYYSAPASMLEGDMSGVTLDFHYQLNSAHDAGPFNVALDGFAEVYVNGTAIDGLDIIDESVRDTMQEVSLDFGDPAFDGIDTANVSSLYIKAEWWGDNVNPSVESYILGNTVVPEPGSISLALLGILGFVAYRRRRDA